MSNIVAIIQARIGSTRLPGKVMKTLIGLPMISHVVQRVSRSHCIDRVVVAFPKTRENDCLSELCECNDWDFYRGSDDNVLDRYYRASRSFNADIIIRITSDCPLIDPKVVDKVIHEFTHGKNELDYMSNCLEDQRTYPRGLDTEVIRFAALEKSWYGDKNPASQEHVTQYIINNPKLFKISGLTDKQNNSSLRWTVDYQEDFDLITRIYNHFGNNLFSWRDALKFVRNNPELTAINAHIKQKEICPYKTPKIFDQEREFNPSPQKYLKLKKQEPIESVSL